MLPKQPFRTYKKNLEVLFKSRFLTRLALHERYEFLQLCHRRTYKAGEYIYYQGDPGTGMYFIEDGIVDLIVESEDADGQKPTFTLSTSDTFGALSVSYEIRRMSSARCVTDCTLLGFFRPDFETLRDRHPTIAIKFMEVIAMIAVKQLEQTTKRLLNVTDVSTAYSLQFDTYKFTEDTLRG
jgi:CRP-like cAMP-binding protein